MRKAKEAYLHGAARAKVLESRLLSLQDLRRAMVDEGYAKSLEAATDLDLYRLYCLLEEATGGSEVTYPFRYPVDGHNAKVLIKSQLVRQAGQDRNVWQTAGESDKLYLRRGTIPPEELREELLSDRFRKVPPLLGVAARRAAEKLAKTGDPRSATVEIDRAVLEMMEEKARALGIPLLQGYAAYYRGQEAHMQTLLAKARLKPFGLEPVAVFLYLKERETRGLRLVLAGRRFHLPEETIREKLEALYGD